LSGDNASAYLEQVRSAFGPNLPAGMTRLAATMAETERGGGTSRPEPNGTDRG
jgi:hypothetical protein